MNDFDRNFSQMRVYLVVQISLYGTYSEEVYASFTSREEADKLVEYLKDDESFKIKEVVVYSTLDEYQDSFLTWQLLVRLIQQITVPSNSRLVGYDNAIIPWWMKLGSS